MPYRTRASYGSTSAPVRAGASDLLKNSPDGWVANQGGPIWWIGSSLSDTTPSADALPVTLRATSLIVDPLVSDPFEVLTDVTHGAPRPVPRWITDPMLLRPDSRFADMGTLAPAPLRLVRSAFWRQWVCSALWHGLGMIVAQVDALNVPIPGTMRVLNQALVQPYRRADGSLVWRIGDGDRYIDTDSDGRFEVGGRPYITVPLRNPHSPIDSDGRTKGVFELSPSAFSLAGKISSYSQGIFHSGVPAGYLKQTTPGMTQEQADELKRKWLEAHGGDRRSIAVLSSTTEFHPISLSPVDAALAEVKRLSIAEVAFAFGMAPEVLGVTMGNSATYSNIESWFRQHRDFALSPWLDAIGGTLTALIPGIAGVSVNLDAFERPDFSSRLDNYKKAIDMGLMTVEEARHMEGMAPLPGSLPPRETAT